MWRLVRQLVEPESWSGRNFCGFSCRASIFRMMGSDGVFGWLVLNLVLACLAANLTAFPSVPLR